MQLEIMYEKHEKILLAVVERYVDEMVTFEKKRHAIAQVKQD